MNAEIDFELRIPVNIDQLKKYKSPEFIFKEFSWYAETQQTHLDDGANSILGIFLHCNITEVKKKSRNSLVF